MWAEWGFVECSLSAVCNAVDSGIIIIPSAQCRTLTMSLDAARSQLSCGTHTKYLLWSTASDWTALLASTLGAVAPRVHSISRKLSVRGVYAGCDTSPERYDPSIGMTFLEPGSSVPRRHISLQYTGLRWEFQESGIALPFESTAAYLVADLPQRFTPALLERYCAQWGVLLFDKSFYLSEGVLFE